jgi:Ca2+-binding EF-hand superfamily protein
MVSFKSISTLSLGCTQEFKKFYSTFWRDRVRRGGLDAARIETLFRSFDADGLGEIPAPDFRFVRSSIQIVFLVAIMILKSGLSFMNIFRIATLFYQALKIFCARLSEADIDSMCAQADTDGDGKIDYVEFIGFLEKNQPLYAVQCKISFFFNHV